MLLKKVTFGTWVNYGIHSANSELDNKMVPFCKCILIFAEYYPEGALLNALIRYHYPDMVQYIYFRRFKRVKKLAGTQHGNKSTHNY